MIKIAFGIFFFYSFIIADDGYLGSVGGNIFPNNEAKSIQMVNEVVKVSLVRPSNENNHLLGLGNYSIHAHCTFWFYNHGEEEYAVVGFPNFSKDRIVPTDSLSNFKCFVNNEPIIADRKELIDKEAFEDGGKVKYDWRGSEDWFSWETTFPSKDTVVIKNEYDGSLGGYSDGSHQMSYILGTGRTWHGLISRGRITFDFSNFATRKYILGINSKVKYTVYDDSVVFTFNNYKPEEHEELWVTFKKPTLYSLKESKASVQDIQNYINEIYAHHGYKFKDQKIQAYFNKKTWYKPDSSFSPNSVFEEKGTIQELVDYIKNKRN
jgi:hypothetical protein